MKNTVDLSIADLDEIDIKLLRTLQKNSRCSFQNIARECKVSGGTIHVRAEKLLEEGVIKNYTVQIDYEKLGFNVLAFVGVKIINTRKRKEYIEEIKKIPNIIEAHTATGDYDFLIKIVARTTRELQEILTEGILGLPETASTETIICFDTPIDRTLDLSIVE